MYAVSGKNRVTAVAFAMITASQFALGVYRTSLEVKYAGKPQKLGSQRVVRIPL